MSASLASLLCFSQDGKPVVQKTWDIAFVRHVRGTDCDDRDNHDASSIIY